MLFIDHITTAWYYPKSNGQAERFLGTFKKGLKKARLEKVNVEALQNFLGVCRIIPYLQYTITDVHGGIKKIGLRQIITKAKNMNG